jgi:hypothetical protein
MKTKVILALTLIAAFSCLATALALSANIQISNTGKINAVGINIYSDSACTTPLTTVDWQVDQGGVATYLAYLKNIKNTDAALSMATSNWIGNPANTTATVFLSWNAPAVLAAGQTVPVTFTLTAVADTGTLDTFSFTTTLIGTK